MEFKDPKGIQDRQELKENRASRSLKAFLDPKANKATQDQKEIKAILVRWGQLASESASRDRKASRVSLASTASMAWRDHRVQSVRKVAMIMPRSCATH